jgi:hypothetical protein
MDGNGLNSYGIKSGYHLLLYFSLDSNAHIDLVEYEYKTNASENYIRKFTQFNSKYILLKFNIDE